MRSWGLSLGLLPFVNSLAYSPACSPQGRLIQQELPQPGWWLSVLPVLLGRGKKASHLLSATAILGRSSHCLSTAPSSQSQVLMTPAGHLEEPFGHSAFCPCPALSTASLVQPWDLLTSKPPHSHNLTHATCLGRRKLPISPQTPQDEQHPE